MVFRYLIYRTDFGNTIVRENPTDTSTGGTEQSLFSDFVIPEIQPLYLWRVTGGISVVPNLDSNINDWLEATAPPPEQEDNATIGFVTGVTETKLDSDIFTGYTATTVPNEIFLIHTGGTDLNTVITTVIDWDNVEVSGSSYLWTGGSDITILQTDDYELSYNIPFNQEGNNNDRGIGANIVLNNSTVLNVTTAAGWTSRSSTAGSIGLPPVILSLTANDILTLVTFRTGQNGTTNSSPNGNILIKKKNLLQ